MYNYDLKYISQFTLDNLLQRKWNSTVAQWCNWLNSLSLQEIKYVSTVLTFDMNVKRILWERFGIIAN